MSRERGLLGKQPRRHALVGKVLDHVHWSEAIFVPIERVTWEQLVCNSCVDHTPVQVARNLQVQLCALVGASA